MGAPLTLEQAWQLKEGDKVFLAKDIGHGWTPQRGLTVTRVSLSTHEDIDRVCETHMRGHKRSTEHGALDGKIAEIQAGWEQSRVAFSQDFIGKLASHGIELSLNVNADDRSTPLGPSRDGKQVYAGISRPYTAYSSERGEPKSP